MHLRHAEVKPIGYDARVSQRVIRHENDQSHCSHDVRQFAGVTPTELVKSLMPDRGGSQADW